MKLDGKISYPELVLLVHEWKDKIIGSYLKKIYHCDGFWLFRFNRFSFVFEPGISVWPGDFQKREVVLHSICIKIRHDLLERKIVDCFVQEGDRTLVLEFHDGFLCLEIFAKGNLILCDADKKVMVLTRPNPHTTHKDTYEIKKPSGNGEMIHAKQPLWKKPRYEFVLEEVATDNTPDTLTPYFQEFWDTKAKKIDTVARSLAKTTTDTPSKKTREQHIQGQIQKYQSQIEERETCAEKVALQESIDFGVLTEVYKERKLWKKKLEGATQAIETSTPLKSKPTKVAKITIETGRWYQEFHWWMTRGGFLVVGGRSAEQNERLVKSHMRDEHFYFHSDEPGSGSFLLFRESITTTVSDTDLADTATGVLCLSQNWKSNRTGSVYWVHAQQVSKTPPSGEFLTKGSFMVRGERNYISVHELCLGYALLENRLMLAPYPIIRAQGGRCLKLIPRPDVKKGNQKEIHKKLGEHLGLAKIPESIALFPFPCKITLNNFS